MTNNEASLAVAALQGEVKESQCHPKSKPGSPVTSQLYCVKVKDGGKQEVAAPQCCHLLFHFPLATPYGKRRAATVKARMTCGNTTFL